MFNRYNIADFNAVRRYILPFAVNQKMAVCHQLPGNPSGSGQAGAEDSIIQPRFQALQQHFRRIAFFLGRFEKIIFKLLFQQKIYSFGFLLFSVLEAIG